MSTLTLADVTQVIHYAQSAMPLTEPPDISDNLYSEFVIRLHRVPADVFIVMLAVHDDLPWTPVEHYDEGGREWSAVRLTLTHANLIVFSDSRVREAAAA